MRFADLFRRRPGPSPRGASAGIAGPHGVILCVALVGCGGGETDGLPRQAASGSVTLDGTPLAVGSIQFLPSSPDQGTPASGEIAEGKFTIPRERGPVPGQYRVIISGGAPAAAPAPNAAPGESTPPPPDPVPAKYNADTILVTEIKAGGPNTFEFALEKKK